MMAETSITFSFRSSEQAAEPPDGFGQGVEDPNEEALLADFFKKGA
jgi:hypothetical protein